MIRDKHCFVVGGMTEQKYREYTLQMEPGDKLYVYTDGVREAINTDVKMFGEDRILSNLNRLKDSAPKEIVKGMHSSIDAFAGEAEQFDDITMMCIEYFGTKDKG
jgi:sigma-B regulation protein RsbU (phosphoserine phosphatase)